MEVVYAVDAQKGNPMLRSMPNGLAGKGQSRAHLDDGIKPSSVSKSETEISIADYFTASKGVFGDVFSKDVNANIGAERDNTRLGKDSNLLAKLA